MNILVVAPHPDDEVLGCGGVMARHCHEGDSVAVLVVTRGAPRLWTDSEIERTRVEALKAHQLLGVRETLFLDYLAPELELARRSEVAESIHKVLNERAIQVMYVPHRGDIHHDHRVVFETALVAARPVGNYCVRTIMAYETLSETEWAPVSSDVFVPTKFVGIEPFLRLKVEAMRCFETQLRDFPNPRSAEGIENLAKVRGATVGLRAAEAFAVIRDIQR